MSFAQSEFLWFFLLTWLVYWPLPRRAQNAWLVLTAAIFYGWVHPWFLLLIGSSALLDYGCALGITQQPERRRLFVGMSLAGNLGMLGTFKYLDFFISELQLVLGISDPATLGLILPVGISFYTFQTMGYTIDVSRGRVKARRDLLDYLVYVSFFPQLVAGPIERASRLLPQIEAPRRFTVDDQTAGISLVAWGAFKKVAIADNLAPWVDRIYALDDPNSTMVVAGTLAFSVQLLADFSGYTDIARGTGRMLGFRLTENFLWPYMAATPTEVWQRFHASLTSWLTDYVFMPLSSARWVRTLTLPGQRMSGQGLLARVTLLTFLVSGFWHGAGGHFIAWGLYLGILAVIYDAARRRLPRHMLRDGRWRWVMVPLMFALQQVALVMFRSTSLGDAATKLSRLWVWGTPDQHVVAAATLGVTLLLASPQILMMLAEWYVIPEVEDRPWYPAVRATGWALAAWGVWFMVRPTVTDFLYFQF